MPAAFQAFQREFGRYLRDPHHVARPPGLPARRAGIYRDLVFNNLCGFVDTCFPVCRSLLGEPRWRRLCRTRERLRRCWVQTCWWFFKEAISMPRYRQRSMNICVRRALSLRWLILQEIQRQYCASFQGRTSRILRQR